MKKLPKFVVCQNKLAAPDKLWILHTQKPRFIAEVMDNCDDEMEHTSTQVTVNGVLYIIVIQLVFDDSNIKPELLDRLADWSHSYIKSVTL